MEIAKNPAPVAASPVAEGSYIFKNQTVTIIPFEDAEEEMLWDKIAEQIQH